MIRAMRLIFIFLFIFLPPSIKAKKHISSDEDKPIESTRDVRIYKLYENLDSFYTYTDAKGNERVVLMIPVRPKPKRVWTSSFIIAGASVASMGILYMMPEEVTNWTRDGLSFSVVANKWYYNVSNPPVVDKDNWIFNYLMHPYFGSVYYETLRCAGYNWSRSFIYSALMSTFFWEYGFESIAERPSVQDLIITPVLGSVLGEALFYAKREIKNKQDRVLGSLALGRISLFLIDPLNEIQDISWRHYLKKHDHWSKKMHLSFQLVQKRPGLKLAYNF